MSDSETRTLLSLAMQNTEAQDRFLINSACCSYSRYSKKERTLPRAGSAPNKYAATLSTTLTLNCCIFWQECHIDWPLRAAKRDVPMIKEKIERKGRLLQQCLPAGRPYSCSSVLAPSSEAFCLLYSAIMNVLRFRSCIFSCLNYDAAYGI